MTKKMVSACNLSYSGGCSQTGESVVGSATKRKNKQMGLHEIKKLLHSKRNSHHIEEAVHRMGQNLSQLYI
jgi:hypothetical protein